jgi:hypothetical protein
MKTKFKVGDAVRYKPKYYYDAWVPDHRKLIIDEIAIEDGKTYYDFHIAKSCMTNFGANSNGYTTDEPEMLQLYSIPITYTLKEFCNSRAIKEKFYDLLDAREYKTKSVKKHTFKEYCKINGI